jgi:hypothetical protein
VDTPPPRPDEQEDGVAADPAPVVAEPPSEPPSQPPSIPPDSRPPERPRSRGRRRAVVLAAVAALVVAAGIVLAVVLIPSGRDGGGGSSAQGTSSSRAPSSSAAPSTGSTSSSAASSTAGSSAAGSSAATPAAAGAPTAADVRNFITGYYGLLPGNPEQAYGLTGPTLRAAASRPNYIAFWHRFSAVRLGPVTATDGSLVGHATVTFVENGSPQTEQHTFTLVRGNDGQLLMDSDRQG